MQRARNCEGPLGPWRRGWVGINTSSSQGLARVAAERKAARARAGKATGSKVAKVLGCVWEVCPSSIAPSQRCGKNLRVEFLFCSSYVLFCGPTPTVWISSTALAGAGVVAACPTVAFRGSQLQMHPHPRSVGAGGGGPETVRRHMNETMMMTRGSARLSMPKVALPQLK